MAQQQHVEFWRKVLLRERLLDIAGVRATAHVYVPFIGDGDLAAELYGDAFILGADLDLERVETARGRVNGIVREADCNGWPFPDWKRVAPGTRLEVADFDSYAYPYASFRAFWEQAPRARRVTLFFTDGERQAMMRTGKWRWPDGAEQDEPDLGVRRLYFNAYFSGHVLPWLERHVAPWRVIHKSLYLRGWMVYWGAIVEAPA